MPKFIIEREKPGAGKAPKEAHQESARRSNAILKELGPEIQWVESYVTDDKVYCIYIAPNEELIKKHAEKAGVPANKISQIRMVADPSIAE
ncbi:MAG TPA: DUF4242 domain-containing protein [Syntrophorhabdaceae bacterium]|nr:DUF4242 domain-containing protein [Syntrophorhabdaceae bacterium]